MLQVCPSDDSHYSKQFIYECLPLLFNILRYSKVMSLHTSFISNVFVTQIIVYLPKL